jgi:hypothetical protein
MPVRTIHLTDEEAALLAALARAERRRPGDQLALLVARALADVAPHTAAANATATREAARVAE